jgi:ureidoacrylate peracid hydrolase
VSATAKSFAEHRAEQSVTRVDPQTTAVLVIDMLNDFVDPAGKMPLRGGGSVIEPIKSVVAKLRAAGGTVVWVCDRHRPDDREFDKRDQHCLEGTWGAELVPALVPEKGDRELVKRRYSAFFGTDLDLMLRGLGVTTIIATGVVTNICVRSTVHDAFFLGYQVLVPEDCVKATGPREQRSSLFDIDTHFGVVTTAAACLAAIEAGRRTHG